MDTDFFTDVEQIVLDKINKVIIWGYPMGTHTQSFIHACWYKTWNYLKKPTYWFSDDNYVDPGVLDYNNSIFIAEGYADANIILNPTCIYFVNFAIHPERYVNAGCRLIEIRCNVPEIHDINIDWDLYDGTHAKLRHLSPDSKYERLTSNKDVGKTHRNGVVTPMNYECIYMYWATDLLPHEIDLEKAHRPRQNRIVYVGSPYDTPNKHAFRTACITAGIQWLDIDPWKTPLSFEDNREVIETSILAPDFRPIGTQQDVVEYGYKNGKNHLAIGYLPCRVLKAISYGQLGITDSAIVKNILGKHVEYDPDMTRLFHNAMNAKDDVQRIQEAMRYVASRHTYLHRVRDMIRAIMQTE